MFNFFHLTHTSALYTSLSVSPSGLKEGEHITANRCLNGGKKHAKTLTFMLLLDRLQKKKKRDKKHKRFSFLLALFPISSLSSSLRYWFYGRGEIVANCLSRDIPSIGETILRQRRTLFRWDVDDTQFLPAKMKAPWLLKTWSGNGPMAVTVVEFVTG